MAKKTRSLPAHLQTIADALVAQEFASKIGKSLNRGVMCVSLTKGSDEIIINADNYLELFTLDRGWHQLYATNDAESTEMLTFISKTLRRA